MHRKINIVFDYCLRLRKPGLRFQAVRMVDGTIKMIYNDTQKIRTAMPEQVGQFYFTI